MIYIPLISKRLCTRSCMLFEHLHNCIGASLSADAASATKSSMKELKNVSSMIKWVNCARLIFSNRHSLNSHDLIAEMKSEIHLNFHNEKRQSLYCVFKLKVPVCHGQNCTFEIITKGKYVGKQFSSKTSISIWFTCVDNCKLF